MTTTLTDRRISKMSKTLRRFTLDDLDTEGRAKALDAARRWASGEILGLVLLGPIGVGKTTVAGAAAVERCKELERIEAELKASKSEFFGEWPVSPPVYVDMATATGVLGKAFGDPDREGMLETLSNPPDRGMILDDLDKVRPSEFAAERVFGAINSAYTHRTPLIVTTNLRLNQLKNRYPAPHGDAIASRLSEYCEVHELTGGDRRLA